MAETMAVRKGAKTKILGVVVIFLALLDSLLSWRGGTQPNDFYFLLFVVGVFLFVLGAIRGLESKAPTGSSNEYTPQTPRFKVPAGQSRAGNATNMVRAREPYPGNRNRSSKQ
jgi:hypothetical protein